MPLATQMHVLAMGIKPILTPESAPADVATAARMWAQAWTTYAMSGGIAAAPKQQLLAKALEVAFVPAGAGPALMLQALSVFWLGLPVTTPPGGIITLFAPVGAMTPTMPPDPTPRQQADALAAMLHTMSMCALWVTVPGGVPSPIL